MLLIVGLSIRAKKEYVVHAFHYAVAVLVYMRFTTLGLGAVRKLFRYCDFKC